MHGNVTHGATVGQKHGRTRGQCYHTWARIIQRCTNPNEPNYARYGGRGIRVCDRWRSYANFAQDMGAPPGPGMSIDRIDNDGHYEPSNCRWADRKTQANNRSSNALLEYRGEVKTLAQWCDSRGIKNSTLWMRLHHYGWPVARALGDE